MHLQRCLNMLQDWADSNGFKFSTSKTVCIHFCRLRKSHPDPQLFLNGNPVPVVEEVKFLNIIFHRKLSFLPHLRYLKNKCAKALNLLRVVAHTLCGAYQQTLLHLYRSLIRSKLDYGCVVYGFALGPYLQMLDPIQNQALGLCLGAFRTSPSSSLSVLANEPPLYIRRKKLSIQYSLKLSSHPHNPSYNTVFNSKFKASFERFLLWVFESNQTCMLLVSWEETFWNVQFWLLLLGSSNDRIRILTIVFISLSKKTPHQKSTEISSSSSVIITRISLDYTQMDLGWGTK